jgi:transcriptional regulator with XRE-family HTH domain
MEVIRSRPAPRGRARSRILAQRFGQELRIARVTAGLTQQRVAQLAQLSQGEVSKAERGDVNVSLDARCRMAAAAGHELGWRLYPVATLRLRDSGQLTLAQAIVTAAGTAWKAELEVPVGPGDLRAADIILRRPDQVIHVEVERVLVDLQAQLRAGQLKRQEIAQRLELPVRFVLAAADTPANRVRAATASELLARTLPMSSREIWTSLRTGEPLGGDGILFVRVRGAGRGG